MRPSFYPRLINEPFNDPGLFISLFFEKRAILFDLGDIYTLSPKDILKISHVFISHTHMDHFVGFDRLLRHFLGREKVLHLYGPEGLLDNVEGKLAGYEWNLVRNFLNRFILHVTEVHDTHLFVRQYRCQNKFQPPQNTLKEPFDGILHDEPAFSVSAVILDHSIPCLGFTIKERFHVNIKKDGVSNLGLEIGPWLKQFKQALFNHKDPNSEFEVKLPGKQSEKKKYTLGDLANRIALITPGQKVTYITDVVYSRSNLKKIVHFAQDADHLFIEAAFLEKDRELARKKYHLTAWQAGKIAKKAGVKQFTLFHFSPRYMDQDHLLRQEAGKAFENKGN
jgi:ribonuclease Z